jgi:hypothetical protein
MRVRRRYVLSGLLLAFICGVGLWAAWPAPSPIGRAGLGKIRPGMRRAEVEALLGGPPGDYRCEGAVYEATAVEAPGWHPPTADYSLDGAEEWRGDRMLIAVKFDRDGRVESAFGVGRAPARWYRVLQSWLPFLP